MATKTATPHRNGTMARTHAADVKEHKVAIPPKRRKASPRKPEDLGLIASLSAMVCDHQIGISVNLLFLLFLTHYLFPPARSTTSKFFRLSYYNSDTKLYGCGPDDLSYVALWTVIFTGLRVATMDYFLDPLARSGGIKTKKGLDRFKEQGWLIVYYSGSWALGMYIIYNSDFWLNLHGIWKGWPFREVDGIFKLYYLAQWGFWVQQILVVNIEEKRKDYAQMFTHHIFTVSLLYLSYGYYHMRVGTVIMCIMDFVDIILPTAKLLKYLGYSTLCDIAFGVFAISWLLTRHVLYMMVCWSIWYHTPVDMAPGCYLTSNHPSTPQNAQKLFIPMSDTAAFEAAGGNDIWGNMLRAYTDRNGPICWNPEIRTYFLALLLVLQVLCCIWFYMVAKVIYKVLSGNGADDVRSDDECDEEEEEEDVDSYDKTSSFINAIPTCTETGLSAMPAYKEEEVGVDALTFARMNSVSHRRQTRSSTPRASGISIPGHGDRKELLGRIGCDKPA